MKLGQGLWKLILIGCLSTARQRLGTMIVLNIDAGVCSRRLCQCRKRLIDALGFRIELWHHQRYGGGRTKNLWRPSKLVERVCFNKLNGALGRLSK